MAIDGVLYKVSVKELKVSQIGIVPSESVTEYVNSLLVLNILGSVSLRELAKLGLSK